MREADAEIATSFLFDHPVALPAPDQPTPIFPPVDAIGPRRDLVTPALLAAAAAAGLSVNPWTVDEPEEIRRLLEAGVSSITTNVPDEALRLRDHAPERDTSQAPHPEPLPPGEGAPRPA